MLEFIVTALICSLVMQHDFPKQDSVIQFVIDAIQAEAFNPKTLFLIGTYTIGKCFYSDDPRFLFTIFNYAVFVEAESY